MIFKASENEKDNERQVDVYLREDGSGKVELMVNGYAIALLYMKNDKPTINLSLERLIDPDRKDVRQHNRDFTIMDYILK